jgi:hypothetical protein
MLFQHPLLIMIIVIFMWILPYVFSLSISESNCFLSTAGLASARARGRSGGRPYKMTPIKLRLAMASMGRPATKVSTLCQELGITRQTLYRHISPDGQLRADGIKLLNRDNFGERKNLGFRRRTPEWSTTMPRSAIISSRLRKLSE